MSAGRTVKHTLKVDLYSLVSDKVEEGVRWGLQRSRKHTDRPSDEVLEENIHSEVMHALSEYIDWGEGDGLGDHF